MIIKNDYSIFSYSRRDFNPFRIKNLEIFLDDYNLFLII